MKSNIFTGKPQISSLRLCPRRGCQRRLPPAHARKLRGLV